MEEWELEFEWLRVRHYVKDAFGKTELPDLQAILFLIGIQELGVPKESFTKEEKQDLMHIAVCELLSQDGYYEYQGRDHDGWPHYNPARPLRNLDLAKQERLLKEKTIDYFKSSLSTQQ